MRRRKASKFEFDRKVEEMKVLVMNCSPVRNGATAEIVNVVSECLKERYEVRSICIDDFDISFCNLDFMG